jgi:hypothetical protein
MNRKPLFLNNILPLASANEKAKLLILPLASANGQLMQHKTGL